MKTKALCAMMAVAALLQPGCKDAQKWIQAYGLTPILPASTLLQPGAMIMRKRFERAGLRVVCDAPNSLGQNFKPLQSKTITGKFARKKDIGYHVGVEALTQIHVDGKSDAVSDVYVTVTNARIVTLTDTDVLQNIGNRSLACQTAIANRQAAGYDISIVSSALIADVVYTVSYRDDASLTASMKLAQMQQVGATLGGNVSVSGENTASATQLVWGIADNKFLAAMGVEQAIPMTAAEVKALRRQSMLSAGDVLAPKNATPPATPPLDENGEASGSGNAYADPEGADADAPFSGKAPAAVASDASDFTTGEAEGADEPVDNAPAEAAEDALQAPPGHGGAPSLGLEPSEDSGPEKSGPVSGETPPRPRSPRSARVRDSVKAFENR